MNDARHATRRSDTLGPDRSDGVQRRTSSGQGDGVFATRPFAAGDIVVVGAIAELLDANNSHASQIGVDRYVLITGLFNLLNHSCDPNCGVRLNESGAYDIVAIRPIRADEQVTFDYAMGNYSIEYFPEECLCGSANCRRRVTGWKDLPEDRRIAYKGVVAPYLLELDARYETGRYDLAQCKMQQVEGDTCAAR